jgi:hypothetical protein
VSAAPPEVIMYTTDGVRHDNELACNTAGCACP